MALTKVTGDFIETGSITQGHLHSSHGITTSHITEGDKLFFTNARVDSRVGSLSTSDLSEGTNLYFTNARVITALTAGDNIAIASNGTISSTDTNTTYSVGDGGLTQNNFTNTLKGKLDGIATGATNTAAPHYTSAIAVGDGGLTQKNFTTTLKNKLDGIAASATNVTNTNQLTNGAGFITSADGGNATTLDGIDSSQFLRSDADDTMSGTLTLTGGNGNAGSGLQLYETATNQYPQIFSNSAHEAMWNYRNSGSQWYVGIRSSSQLLGTTGFHFYNTTSGQTVGGFEVGGNFHTIGSVTSAGSMFFAGGRSLVAPVHSGNIEIRSNIVSASGLMIADSAGTFKMQLYGTGNDYGFLTHEWGSWDLRKNNNGELYLRVSGTDQTAIHSGNYSSYALPLSGGTMSNDITFSNLRKGLVGVYNATQTQAIFAMGAAYKLTDGGASNTYGNIYGLAWSYNPNYGGTGNNPQSKASLEHQLLVMNAGVTKSAIGNGIWTSGIITTISYGTSINWWAAYNTANAALPKAGGTIAGNGYIDFGPNSSWSDTLRVGGNGHGGSTRASVVTTDGNLHLDPKSGHATYLNYYSNGIIYLNGTTYYISSNGANYNGTAANANTLDGIDSSQFVRSDTYDTMNGAFVNTVMISVSSGDAKGYRFWDSNNYKISMGNSSLYHYGTVSADYSIKTQMNDTSSGRGFTWGRLSYAPIASLNSTSGDFQIAGKLKLPLLSGSYGGNYDAVISSYDGWRVGKATSSLRYKKNIIDSTIDTTKLYDLRLVEFDWKEENRHDFGYIAEETHLSFPEITVYNPEGEPDAVNYRMMATLLLEEVKKLKTRIEALEQK